MIRRAWAWTTGLRVRTRRWQETQDAMMDLALAKAVRAAADAERAHREKREAQRVLTILAEPLKDWDLDDFPPPSRLRAHTLGLSFQDQDHLANVLDAYRTVASDAARIRMTSKTNDQARQRGWADRSV